MAIDGSGTQSDALNLTVDMGITASSHHVGSERSGHLLERFLRRNASGRRASTRLDHLEGDAHPQLYPGTAACHHTRINIRASQYSLGWTPDLPDHRDYFCILGTLGGVLKNAAAQRSICDH